MTPKYKIGDIVKTSADAHGWGSNSSINNRDLKITSIEPVNSFNAVAGPKYYFEGGYATREIEIVGIVKNAGPMQYRFKVGDKVRRTGSGWASGPDSSNKDHQSYLDVNPRHACYIVEAWPGALGYIVESLTGERGSFAENQLEFFDGQIGPVDESKISVLVVHGARLQKLKDMYREKLPAGELQADWFRIIDLQEQVKFKHQGLHEGQQVWCNLLYKRLKGMI
jgi:hypothetical protein